MLWSQSVALTLLTAMAILSTASVAGIEIKQSEILRLEDEREGLLVSFYRCKNELPESQGDECNACVDAVDVQLLDSCEVKNVAYCKPIEKCNCGACSQKYEDYANNRVNYDLKRDYKQWMDLGETPRVAPSCNISCDISSTASSDARFSYGSDRHATPVAFISVAIGYAFAMMA